MVYAPLNLNFGSAKVFMVVRGMDIRYIAGFFDGEGSIHFSATSGSLYLKCLQKRGEVLKQIQAFFNAGKITVNSRGISEWTVSNQRDIENILTDLLPYLIVKRRAAELTLQFLQLRKEAKRILRQRYSRQELEVLKQLLEENESTNSKSYNLIVKRLE